MAKETGIKYFLIIAKHHDGLCNWDCKFTNYKIPNTPFKRDALKKVVNAKRAESIKVKFYYFLLDWQHPDFTINDFHPITPKNNVAKKDNINAIR